MNSQMVADTAAIVRSPLRAGRSAATRWGSAGVGAVGAEERCERTVDVEVDALGALGNLAVGPAQEVPERQSGHLEEGVTVGGGERQRDRRSVHRLPGPDPD